MIRIDNLSKIYTSKNRTTALNKVSVHIKENTIVGLIGSNGAGKSTLMKILANQIKATSGDYKLTNVYNGYSNICLLSDQEKTLDNYTLKDLYKIMPEYYPDFSIDLAKETAQVLDVDANKKYIRLSKGQKGKINLILSLASRAYITLLDETYISLDALSRSKYFNLLLEDYNEFKRTYIISTHYVHEIANLFDDIIILNAGKVILHESKDCIEEKSVTIFGSTEIGESILSDFNVIHKESIGKKTFFSVFDDINNIRNSLLSNNFQISTTPLEKWFVQYIENEGGLDVF